MADTFIVTVCNHCPAEVIWGDTGKTGMPVNAVPDPAGNIVLIGRPIGSPKIIVTADVQAYPGMPRWMSHFVDCPYAAQLRKTRIKPVPPQEATLF